MFRYCDEETSALVERLSRAAKARIFVMRAMGEDISNEELAGAISSPEHEEPKPGSVGKHANSRAGGDEAGHSSYLSFSNTEEEEKQRPD